MIRELYEKRDYDALSSFHPLPDILKTGWEDAYNKMLDKNPFFEVQHDDKQLLIAFNFIKYELGLTLELFVLPHRSIQEILFETTVRAFFGGKALVGMDWSKNTSRQIDKIE